jgi:hypothetical protein
LPSHPHDEFMRLCALSIAGELTAEEEARLDEHLLECEDCRKASAEFDSLVSEVLPALGAEISSEIEDAPDADEWSVEDAQQRLMKAVDEETAKRTASPKKTNRQNRLVGFLILFGSVAAASVLGYRAGVHRNRSAARVAPQSSAQRDSAAPVSVIHADFSDRHEELLQNQIASEKRKSSELLAQLQDANVRLSEATESLSQAIVERDQARLESSSQQTTLQSLQAKLDAVPKQPEPDTRHMQDLEAKVTSLDKVVTEKDATIAEQTELLQHDRDIRNLMSARDLYIAEIYDVAKDGATKKPFGRVFYTRDKSLIFYGFDLDQQPHVTQTSVFQAWGRQDTSHDVSLGLLYQDETSKNRWVLKFNDASTLARLDAVFVTVEPKGGSAKPTSKPLLFAYLHIAPNHP